MGGDSQFGQAPENLLMGPVTQSASMSGKFRSATVTSGRTRFAEQATVISALVLSTGAFVNLFPGELGIENVEQGQVFSQVLWTILYISMFFYVRREFRNLVRIAWQDKLYVLLLGWAGLSIVWSIDQQVSVRHFVVLVLTSLFGVYLAFRYSLGEQLRLVAISLGIVIAASIAACLLFPDYGITADEFSGTPQWQGVFTHKNTFARMAVLAALILVLYFIRRRKSLMILIGVCLLFVLVVFTQAKTSLVYTVIGLVAFLFVRVFKKNPASRKKVLLLGISTFGGSATWICFNWERFVGALGKDPTITGRTVLWALSFTWIWKRPFLGYGYDAFWSDYYGPAADFRAAAGWLEAPHAHNGLINLWLDLGLIGVLIFVLGFVLAYRTAWNLAKVAKTAQGLWPITFLTFLGAYSLVETAFLSRNDLIWVLYVSLLYRFSSNYGQRPQRSLADSSRTVRP